MALSVVIMAAGKGTRMRSARPKVLHLLGGRSLLGHVVHTAESLAPQRLQQTSLMAAFIFSCRQWFITNMVNAILT